MNAIVKSIQEELVENKNFPSFKAGDTVTAYYEIREGDKVRIQFFRGVVIQIKGQGLNKTFTIRKMSGTTELKEYSSKYAHSSKIRDKQKRKS